MFHRVKSEPQTNQQGAQAQAPVVEEQEVQDVPTTNEVQDDVIDASTHEDEIAEQEESETMTEENETAEVEEETVAEAPAPAYAPQMPRSYVAPSYSNNYSAPQQEEAVETEEENVENRSLTISRGITMSGEIEACDHLVVEGTVEAALKGARILDIAESGTFYGTVDIQEATVAGRFEGDLTVAGRLTIRAGGIITGSFAYGELEVEAGAVIDGRLTPIAALQQQKTKPVQQNKTVVARKNASSSKQAAPAPANSAGGLFSSKTA